MTTPIYSDEKSDHYLSLIAAKEKLSPQVVPNVKTVLVILSSRGVTSDVDGLKQKILAIYPGAEIYYRSTSGHAFKSKEAPVPVDLLIDFTGPGMRQGWLYALKLRRQARFTVGRNAGLFRKKRFDRVIDEKDPHHPPSRDVLDRERIAQKQVLELVGIPSIPISGATPDRGKEIALDLPLLQRH